MIRLRGWKHYLRLRLGAQVEGLEHFPVMVRLSASGGANGFDATDVFRKLGANKLKIALTASDGQTQLNCEIQQWDEVNEEAILWVSRAGWLASDIYLYYDPDRPDNTDYVGVTGSAPGTAVWDAAFVEVIHGHDLTTSTVQGSVTGTAYNKAGANNPLEVDGLVGKAQEFDGQSSYIDLGSGSLGLLNEVTIEALFKGSLGTSLVRKQLSANYIVFDWAGVQQHILSWDGGTDGLSTGGIRDGVRHHSVLSWRRNAVQGFATYKDGILVASRTSTDVPIPDIGGNLYIGRFNGVSEWTDGDGEEIRISSVARSSDWIAATKSTLFDDLVSFEGPFLAPDDSNSLGGEIIVRSQQVHSTLLKDVIPSYNANGKSVSVILAELLDYQEVTRVSLGTVSPTLDIVTNYSLEVGRANADIWSAIKGLRGQVGGYLVVSFDPEDPSVRTLDLRNTIGENKGQQIRLGKNLTGIDYTEDFIDFANRLYAIGEGIELDDLSFTRQDIDQSEGATYGYLALRDNLAYGGWTGPGDSLPGHVTIEKPTGSWTTPTGSSGVWNNHAYAWDGQTAPFASYPLWPDDITPYLIVTCPATDSTQVRVYVSGDSPLPMECDIFYSGDWHNVRPLALSTQGWNTVTFGQQSITGVRVRFYNWLPAVSTALVGEIEVWDSTGWTDDTVNWQQGDNEATMRIPIAGYDDGVSYVVSYDHAKYVLAFGQITGRADIVSRSLTFKTDDPAVLLNLAKTKLTEILQPLRYYEVQMVDLSVDEGRDFEELQLGSTVTVIDEGLGLEYQADIVRIQHPDLLHPEKIRVEIANKTPDLIDWLKG